MMDDQGIRGYILFRYLVFYKASMLMASRLKVTSKKCTIFMLHHLAITFNISEEFCSVT